MEGIKRRHLSVEAWRDLFGRHAGSGRTIMEVCRLEGVSTHSYRRWKARLEGVPEGHVPAAAPVTRSKKVVPTGTMPFVDLGTLGAPPAPAAGRLELRLDLGGGVTLHVVRG